MPLQHILVATDGSDHAGRAVALAAAIAQAADATLAIVTVSADPAPATIRQIAHAEGDAGAALDVHAQTLLADAEALARRSGSPRVERIAAWGDPAETILECAREAVDLVVLGRRGRGRLAGLLLGSVSQKLVSLAPCAVMVVP